MAQWIRKTDAEIEEIKKELRKTTNSLAMPLMIFILSFYVFGIITQNFEYGGLWDFLLSFTSALLVIFYQKYTGRSMANSPTFKICNNCMDEDRIGLKKCNCGGTYEPPEFYYEKDNIK